MTLRSPNTPSTTSGTQAELARRELDWQIHKYDVFLADLKARRNALSPSARLPSELLAKIFITLLASGHQDFSSCNLSWIGVTNICRRWRSVALNCAQLWSSPVFTTRAITEEMLRRSKRSALAVRASVSYGSRSASVELALSQMERIRVLHLEGSQVQTLYQHMQKPAPLLESLRLCTPYTYRNSVSTELFAGMAPRLRHVEITGHDIKWDEALFRGLTHLEISGVAEQPAFTTMMNVLSQCPLLETLILDRNLPRCTGEEEPGSPVDLSRLSKLRLTGPLGACTRILLNVTFPASAMLDIQCQHSRSVGPGGSPNPYYPTPIVFGQLLSRIAEHMRGGETAQTLAINYRGPPMQFRVWSTISSSVENTPKTPPSLELHIDTDTWDSAGSPGCARTILDVLPLATIRALHVRNPIEFSVDAWELLLRPLEKLKALAVVNAPVLWLCEALLPDPGDETSSVLVPKMRTLVLGQADFTEDGYPLERLRHCLIMRYENKAEVRNLHLNDACWLYELDVEELEQIVANVVWDQVEQESEADEEDDCVYDLFQGLGDYYDYGDDPYENMHWQD
jgi:hypothetical protein